MGGRHRAGSARHESSRSGNPKAQKGKGAAEPGATERLHSPGTAAPRSCTGSNPARRGCLRARCILGSSQMYLYHAARSSRCTAAAGAKVREGESGSHSTAGTGTATAPCREMGLTAPNPTDPNAPPRPHLGRWHRRNPTRTRDAKEAVWVGNGRRPTWHRAAPGAVRGHSHHDLTATGHGGGGGWEPHGMARTPQMATGRGGGRGDGRTAPRPRSRRTDNGWEPPRPAPYLGVKVAPSAVSAVPAGGGERR